MRKIGFILLVLSGFSCNPYQPYYFTHYHISADYDPGTGHLSANVRMVLVPTREYHDSIILDLNGHMEILSLTAQELKYYEFDRGRLVLYIQEAVMPGDQLHISLAYEGQIGGYPGWEAGPPQDYSWYPVNPDIGKITYRVELDLPDNYVLEEPATLDGPGWNWGSVEPRDSICFPPLVYKRVEE